MDRRGDAGEPVDEFGAEFAELSRRIARRFFREHGVPACDVDDLVAETHLSAMKHLTRLKELGEWPRAMGKYVEFRALGVLRDHRRRQERAPLLLGDRAADSEDPGHAPLAGLLSGEGATALRECVEELTDVLAEVLRLAFLEGRSSREIVERFGTNREWLRRQRNKIRTLTAACLKRKGVL